MSDILPVIPPKRYFTIGEVSQLCAVKPYVLRYWEQEFTQLRPMKRRGNRRYYQHHEVLLVRRIRELLYDQGFTISGARNRLAQTGLPGRARAQGAEERLADLPIFEPQDADLRIDVPVEAPAVPSADVAAPESSLAAAESTPAAPSGTPDLPLARLRAELLSIRRLLED